jgi:hypothetical protein
MKSTRTLLAVVLLSFLACGSAGAQLFQIKTTEYFEIYINRVDGSEVIAGQFDVHEMIHIKYDNGYYVHWSRSMSVTGEAVSQSTGETFRANYKEKADRYDPGPVYYRSLHLNLVGDQGTHIQMALTLKYDWSGDGLVITIVKIREKEL